ncbi:MAG: HupE / UreJ protein [Bacteroidetes bacterium RIFOXYA12_FULL_35_11]|nr:MAG: HupE / UreJ protein [Bacteroidetes bacterium GWF2_35_48]OFY78422.1 MAG: HupE / UreJ protein [Bacteroidetes bacterium RIFOXYA12_FULL_35_11]OFY93487.1 MAG: HupE / UreJ protein [Bacteroidetes bacterium RIFOXYC12_FULL_35_7]HBX50861.1 HupE / UreJ protein [Bacteroidales bacterium]
MSIFEMYLKLGISHITDLKGYDHILFLLTLCAVYTVSEWRRVLILITAFTIGHTSTLVLATFNIIRIDSGLIEFLIPLTIFITAISNILLKTENVSLRFHIFKYITAMFFGLIHGFGFSNYLRSLLLQEENLALPLFSFNLGIEIGQILIIIGIFLLAVIFIRFLKMAQRDWSLILSGMGLGVSIILMLERNPFILK